MMNGMQGLRLALACLVLGCGGPSTPATTTPPAPPAATTTRQPVECGPGLTCGVDEFCEQTCTCCGAYIPDPSQASGTVECKPLPAACHGSDAPECMQRVVAHPCA